MKMLWFVLTMAAVTSFLFIDIPIALSQQQQTAPGRVRKIKILRIEPAAPPASDAVRSTENVKSTDMPKVEDVDGAKAVEGESAEAQKEFYLMGVISEYGTFNKKPSSDAKYGIDCCVKVEDQKFQFCVMSVAAAGYSNANDMMCQLLQSRNGRQAILYFKNIDGSDEELVNAVVELLKEEGKQARIITKVE